jgi:hypothetical protein
MRFGFPMSTTELRRRVKKQVERLPADRLQSAADYLLFLQHGDVGHASNGKLSEFRARIQKAERDIAAGRTVPVERLRRK